MPAAVVIPVRSFATGKARLASVLDPDARARLGRALATRVRAAAGDLSCHVVTSDEDVRAWAAESGASIVGDPGGGLDAAVQAGVDAASAGGATRVIVAHADLPRARDLTWLAEVDGVVIVTDRRGDGTNVMSLPLPGSFPFAYGPGSCTRHRELARAAGHAVRVATDDDLAWDIDEPSDLEGLGPDLTLPN